MDWIGRNEAVKQMMAMGFVVKIKEVESGTRIASDGSRWAFRAWLISAANIVGDSYEAFLNIDTRLWAMQKNVVQNNSSHVLDAMLRKILVRFNITD